MAIRVAAEIPVRRFVGRLGIPASTWYHWRAGHLQGREVRRWPASVVDAIEERAAQEAHKWSAWGHRKIHAMLRADGEKVSQSSVKRALKRRGLLVDPETGEEVRCGRVARVPLLDDVGAVVRNFVVAPLTVFESRRPNPSYANENEPALAPES